MRKTVLILSLLFTSSLAYAAGGPIPGVDVSLEQIPGGIYHTQNDCLKKGGKVMHKRDKIFCMMTQHVRKKVVKFKAGSELATKQSKLHQGNSKPKAFSCTDRQGLTCTGTEAPPCGVGWTFSVKSCDQLDAE